MHRLLLALPLALLPLAMAHAHDEHDHDHVHGTLGAHEHGVAKLNAVLDGNTLELELDSPAMNIVGFEHAVASDADKTKVAAARQQLEQPLKLFGLAQAAGCSVEDQELESPLFADAVHGDEHEQGHQHTDVHAHYQLTCTAPAKLVQIDLGPLFKTFPQTQKINVQLIGPDGQKGAETAPGKAVVAF